MRGLQYLLVPLAFSVSASLAQELSDEQLEQWFESDDMAPPYEQKGGGATLRFIHPPPAEKIPRSHTRLTVDAPGATSGWVTVAQCHDDLDAVPDAEVVYRFKQMRQLQITEVQGIEKAWVDGQSVQLKNVGKPARLCVALQARLLHRTENGRYRMQYGPFQRRFLDSWFPLQVTLEVDYAKSGLQFSAVSPQPTAGFSVVDGQGVLRLDAWFRGELMLDLLFETGVERGAH